jgi:hypothetical protein
VIESTPIVNVSEVDGVGLGQSGVGDEGSGDWGEVECGLCECCRPVAGLALNEAEVEVRGVVDLHEVVQRGDGVTEVTDDSTFQRVHDVDGGQPHSLTVIVRAVELCDDAVLSVDRQLTGERVVHTVDRDGR